MANGRSSSLKCIRSRVFWLPETIAREEMNSIDTTPMPPIRRTIRRKSRSVTPAIGASQRGGSTRTEPTCTMAPIVTRGGGAPPLPCRAAGGTAEEQAQAGAEEPPLQAPEQQAEDESGAAPRPQIGERGREVDPGEHPDASEAAPGLPYPEHRQGMQQEAAGGREGDGHPGGRASGRGGGGRRAGAGLGGSGLRTGAGPGGDTRRAGAGVGGGGGRAGAGAGVGSRRAEVGLGGGAQQGCTCSGGGSRRASADVGGGR